MAERFGLPSSTATGQHSELTALVEYLFTLSNHSRELRTLTEGWTVSQTAALIGTSFVESTRYHDDKDVYRRCMLVDTERHAILDVHCTTEKRHDTQRGWQVVRRNTGNLASLAADKSVSEDHTVDSVRVSWLSLLLICSGGSVTPQTTTDHDSPLW